MPAGKEPFSLYIHIPYCERKCPYCDFNVHVARSIPEREYAQALVREIDFYAASEDWRGRSLQSLFFGGGTPSTFTPAAIGKVVEAAERAFPFEEEAEITLEANPGSDDRKHFLGYRSAGINRLSLGAQSFQPRLLEFLGRGHSADETRASLRVACQVGFENFSMDLIYGIPSQSVADLEADLREATGFDPPHLSAYNLTIEEGTPFHREYRAGRLKPLSEEDEVAMAELVEDILSRSGLERYEVSNYARPGWRSRHNSNYWQGGDYLGLGAGAHSHRRFRGEGVSGRRWSNERHPGRYMERIEREGCAVTERETIDLRQSAAEFMFLGLRMVHGILLTEFSNRFGKRPDEFYPEINNWLEEGLMEQEDGRLRLTRRGFLVADSIFLQFV